MSPAGEASGDLLEETSGSQAWITEIFTGLGRGGGAGAGGNGGLEYAAVKLLGLGERKVSH